MVNKTNYTTLFLKGALMGTCDVVPGISGGTIAFITGIYQRLIEAIKGLASKDFLKIILALIKGNFKEAKILNKKLDLKFLATLFLGIFTAIFLVSSIILNLLSTYPAYTITFFVGLILASSILIFKQIESHNKHNYITGALGLILGLSLIFLVPQNIQNISPLYIALGGFLAISAAFLPGISGSFILLILGLYETFYNSIHAIREQAIILLSFISGAILGAIFISRLINYLFKTNKSKTLYFLFGLVIGSLSVPIQKIILLLNHTPTNKSLLLLLLIMGFFIVIVTERIATKY